MKKRKTDSVFCKTENCRFAKNKSFLVMFFLFILILNTFLIKAADQPPMPPTINAPILGDINPDTGQPKTLEQFQSIADNLTSKEQNKSFLMQDLTIMLWNNPYIGPFLFYTEKFLSFLNPIWNFVFELNFSWSLAFFASLIIWIFFIYVCYVPAKTLTNFSPILTFIASIIIATLMGWGGVIKVAVDALTFFVLNIWIAIICIVIGLFISILYGMILKQIGKKIKKDEEEEELSRSKDRIKAAGEAAGRLLKN